MNAVRSLGLAAVLVVAVVLQATVLPLVGYDGVTANLVLLLVVAAALARGPEVAMVCGFTGGLLLDLAPPADHVAGRWALALVVAGFVAGRVRNDAGSHVIGALVTVAASSFIATSLFAISGVLLGDSGVTADDALRVVPLALLYDVLAATLLLPLMMRTMRSLRPPQVAL